MPVLLRKDFNSRKKKHLQECVSRNKEYLKKHKETEEKIKDLTNEKESF
jgi:hypothetical protein